MTWYTSYSGLGSFTSIFPHSGETAGPICKVVTPLPPGLAANQRYAGGCDKIANLGKGHASVGMQLGGYTCGLLSLIVCMLINVNTGLVGLNITEMVVVSSWESLPGKCQSHPACK